MRDGPLLIVDCDPGHDDALALGLAHVHANVLGITSVSGNAPLEDTTRNALGMAALLGSSADVYAGEARPLVGEPRHAGGVHGTGGLGRVALPKHDRVISELHAVDYLIEATRKRSNVWLVPLGPLTNIARAMERDPELVERIEGISLMGGSAGAGNVTAVAEFNIWADPEAAEIVMASGAHIRMSGLNLTRQWQSDDTVAARLKESGSVKAQVAAAILDDIHDRMESLGRGRRAALHDPCAVLAVTHPELVGFEERHVTVETAGVYTRGMTVVDERPTAGIPEANVEVGYQIDSKSAMELLMGAFEGA